MSELYNDFTKNEIGVLGNNELSNDFIQKTILENQGKTNYVIKFHKKEEKKSIKKPLFVEKNNTKKNTKKKEEFEDVMKEKFESMMSQFQNMVQLSQLIQMNQMNQIQIMNQLLELKTSVIDTRQDLGYRLKEINTRIDEISSKRNNGGSKKAIKEEVQEDENDIIHLTPLKKETLESLYEIKDIDENFIKNVLKGKSISGYMKIFDLLYKSSETSKKDIYPIRIIKARTYQFLNENRKWEIDTNGTVILSILVNNINLLFSKINNDNYRDEEYDINEFIDNQTYIEDLNDKKIKTQLLNSIKDAIVNHSLNHT